MFELLTSFLHFHELCIDSLSIRLYHFPAFGIMVRSMSLNRVPYHPQVANPVAYLMHITRINSNLCELILRFTGRAVEVTQAEFGGKYVFLGRDMWTNQVKQLFEKLPCLQNDSNGWCVIPERNQLFLGPSKRDPTGIWMYDAYQDRFGDFANFGTKRPWGWGCQVRFVDESLVLYGKASVRRQRTTEIQYVKMDFQSIVESGLDESTKANKWEVVVNEEPLEDKKSFEHCHMLHVAWRYFD